jgi:hypothetical protein
MLDKKFHQTQISKIYPLFEKPTMRNPDGLIMVFSIIQYFKYRNILEMGFYQGLTFSTMIEATGPGAKLTAIDIDFKRELFDQYYLNSEFVTDQQINLLNISTHDFVPKETYDFINVDCGTQREFDIITATQCIDPTGIIMLDDYKKLDHVVDALLDLNTGFVPFLADSKALYFHHESHNAADFLDNVIENMFVSFCHTDNKIYKEHVVKTVEPRPVDITQLDSVFRIFAQTQNI